MAFDPEVQEPRRLASGLLCMTQPNEPYVQHRRRTGPQLISPTLTVKTFGITDTGRICPANEDHFLIAELTKAMRVSQTSLPGAKTQFGEEHGHLFLVADGMEGHQGGEYASALAVLAIEQFTLNTLRWFFESNRQEAQRVLAAFQTAIRDADVRVREEAADHAELKGMGTTVTMAYHLDAQLCVVHVGDSRAYLYRGSELHQSTRRSPRRGRIGQERRHSAEDAADHRFRHVITNVVGGTEAGVKVEAHALEVRAGDRLLLCSDGLTEMVTDDAIAATLRAELEPESACTKLVAQANEAGGRDNITVLIVRFDPEQSES